MYFKIRYYFFKRAYKINKHKKYFNKLFTSVDGFSLSKQARLNNDAMEYVYGEIDFESFIALLSLTHPNENTVFYDLGSGCGKAVIASALVYPIKQSIGIELFSNLDAAAKKVKAQINDDRIEFYCQDIMQASLENATHIFIHATGFFGETWQKICEKLASLDKVKCIITISKPLKHPAFILKKSPYVQMSWGITQAFIHEKTPPAPSRALLC